MKATLFTCLFALLTACGGSPFEEAPLMASAGNPQPQQQATADAGSTPTGDKGSPAADASSTSDAHTSADTSTPVDSASPDAGQADVGTDTAVAVIDAGSPDVNVSDTYVADTSPPAPTASCGGTVSDAQHAVLDTNWTFNAVGTQSCASVNGTQSCVTCDVDWTSDTLQCSNTVTLATGTWNFTFNPTTSYVYISTRASSTTPVSMWTPTCK